MSPLLLAFFIGFLAGLRSLTPPAAVAWAVHLGWLKVKGLLAIVGTLPIVWILTILAIGELAADKWSRIPNRTSAQGLTARILMGGVTGAIVIIAGGESVLFGALLGAVGGITGAFAGFNARRRLVQKLRVPDYYIAVVEDLVAIGGCLWIVSRFA
jgi:uncharacterized membrane protein